MDNFGEIEQKVVCEYNSRSSVPFPTDLANGSTVELATITLDLPPNFGGVLLQGTVNWSATFTIPPSVVFAENGFAEATFQILRNEQVIYQVTQTIRQKDFEISSVSQTNTAFEIVSLLYHDTFPLAAAGVINYTVRATDIALFSQTGTFLGSDTPTVAAAVGAVILAAREANVCVHTIPEDSEPAADSVEKMIVYQSQAPMPATIPFSTPLTEGATVELARIDVGGVSPKNGIFLSAVVNWGVRVTSNGELVNMRSSGLANVTFELLSNSKVIYRTTQTAVQTFLSNSAGSVETATFEITNISCLDIPTGLIEPGINTYILRAANIVIIQPVISDGGPAQAIVSAGPVTLVAEVIDSDMVKKKSKHRNRRRR